MNTWMGLAVGVAAGMAAGLLAAPMRGRDMRTSLRTRVDQARSRAMMLVDEGRRALGRGEADRAHAPLTATLGEIAQTHPGIAPANFEAQS